MEEAKVLQEVMCRLARGVVRTDEEMPLTEEMIGSRHRTEMKSILRGQEFEPNCQPSQLGGAFNQPVTVHFRSL